MERLTPNDADDAGPEASIISIIVGPFLGLQASRHHDEFYLLQHLYCPLALLEHNRQSLHSAKRPVSHLSLDRHTKLGSVIQDV